MTCLRPSTLARFGFKKGGDDHIDPDEMRRLVELGKARGLIAETAKPGNGTKARRVDLQAVRADVDELKAKGLIIPAGVARPVEKNGRDVCEQHLGLRSQWMDVTPAMAARWLENNFRNRPISEDVVIAYARDMTNGVWVATHQGIAFNDRDELIDGQHRLIAITRCGLTIRMMVTFGLPSKIEGKEMTTMDAVDRGRTRSVADQLRIQHGMKDGSTIAAICASIGTICCGVRTRRLSVGQTLEIYRAFEGPVNFVIENRPKAHGLRMTSVLSGFAFAMGSETDFGKCRTAIAAMFQRLVGTDALKPGSPMGLLRAFLTSDDAKLLNSGKNIGLAELVMHAILLEERRMTPEKLELSPAGVDHFRKLQKERVRAIAEMFALKEVSA